MAFDIRALLTDEARRRRSEHEATGKSFKVVGFVLGNAGHDPLDPTTALSPDPGASDCGTVVFGPKAVSSFSYANDSCPIWDCVVDYGEGVTLFSSICLLAQVITSPVPNDPEVEQGYTFVYAIHNLPQRAKLDTETLTIRAGTQR